MLPFWNLQKLAILFRIVETTFTASLASFSDMIFARL